MSPKRSAFTYGQLEKVLRSLGFVSRPGNSDPPGRIFEHARTGALVMLPALPETEKAYEHHLIAARLELDNFGIADPTTFDLKLRKVG